MPRAEPLAGAPASPNEASFTMPRARRIPPRSPGFLAAVTGAFLLSCAYSFSGSSLPGHIKTIAVPTFGNETLQPGLEREATEAVIEVFVDDGRLNLGGTGSADALVEGRVLGYENQVFGIGAGETAEEYRVTIRFAVVVKDRVKGKDLWSNDALVAQSTYTVDARGDEPSSEEAARAEAIRKAAEDILAHTLEEW